MADILNSVLGGAGVVKQLPTARQSSSYHGSGSASHSGTGGADVLRDASGGPASRELEVGLAAVERFNPILNSLITVMGDSARADARAADWAHEQGDWLGLLHGVPITVKDCFNIAGVRTTFGSAIYEDNIAERDSEVICRLRQQGAVFVGKNNLTEFCYGATGENPRYGRNNNPWDPNRITGGSSSGCATAVAAGMCRISLGSDTGGSIRVPAALCGVAGLRPTVGRVAATHSLGVSATFDTIGPLAYGVADVARAYASIAGYDPEDPTSIDRPVDDVLASLNAGAAGLRIGIPTNYFFDDLQSGVGEAVSEAAGVLEKQGARLVDIHLPNADAMHSIVLFSLVTADMADLHRDEMELHGDLIGPEVMRRLRLGLAVGGRDYSRSLRALGAWRATFRAIFDDLDLIITPTTPLVAPLWSESSDMVETTKRIARFTYGVGATGLPSMTVPCGFGEADMPIGMQLIARWWDEGALFRVGRAFQRATDFHRRRPSIGARTEA